MGDNRTPFGSGIEEKLFRTVLRDPAKRDARAYVISAVQRDFPTATKFVNTLRHAGIDVERATRDFSVNGKRYPAGSFVVTAAQAFRPYVLDMFEPQDHLAYQMGVQFDRVLDGFDCPCERVQGLAKPLAGTVAGAGAPGFVFSPAQNDAFIVVNRLLKAKLELFRTSEPIMAGGKSYAPGAFYVAGGASSSTIRQAAEELGVDFQGVATRPAGTRLLPKRIALLDQYGGSMPSGQIRFILEQFEFPYQLVYPQDVDAGTLRARFDVVILPSGVLGGRERGRNPALGPAGRVPAAYQQMTGQLSEGRSVPQLGRFLQDGGTVLAIGTSSQLGAMLGLPVSNALVERTASGAERVLSAEKFYVPGSILRVAVDTTDLVAAGEPERLDVFYDNSPAFRLAPDATRRGVRPVAWFDSDRPLRSGWAWGQGYLDGAVAIADARVGKGRLVLYGPEITFRAQPHGTFKLLFNGVFATDAADARGPSASSASGAP